MNKLTVNEALRYIEAQERYKEYISWDTKDEVGQVLAQEIKHLRMILKIVYEVPDGPFAIPRVRDIIKEVME